MNRSGTTFYEILCFIKPFAADHIFEVGDYKIVPVGDCEGYEHWHKIILSFFEKQTDRDSEFIDSLKEVLSNIAPNSKAVSVIHSSITVPNDIDASEHDVLDMALSKSRSIVNIIKLLTDITSDVVNVMVLFNDSVISTYPGTTVKPLMIQIDGYKYSIKDIPRLYEVAEKSEKYRLLCDMYQASSRANINDLKILQYWSMLEAASKLYAVKEGLVLHHKDGAPVLDHKDNELQTGSNALANIYQMLTETCGNNHEEVWQDLRVLSAMRDAVTHCGAISAYTLLDFPHKRKLVEKGLEKCGAKPYQYDYWVDKIERLSRFFLVNAAEKEVFD